MGRDRAHSCFFGQIRLDDNDSTYLASSKPSAGYAVAFPSVSFPANQCHTPETTEARFEHVGDTLLIENRHQSRGPPFREHPCNLLLNDVVFQYNSHGRRE